MICKLCEHSINDYCTVNGGYESPTEIMKLGDCEKKPVIQRDKEGNYILLPDDDNINLIIRDGKYQWMVNNGLEGLIYLAVIAAMFGGGFGGFGFGNNGFANAIGYENLATQAQVDRGFDNQNSMANQREILSAVTNGTAQTVAATNSTFHDTLAVLNDKYGELQRDIAALAVGQANALANQNSCCCETKMQIADSTASINAGIAQNRYDAAMNTAAINANTTAQIQSVKDMLAQDKIEALQGRINQLELQQAVSGVVRYPMTTSYAVPSPCFAGCGCGA